MLDGSRVDVPLSMLSRVDNKLVASAAKVGSTAESEAMIGSRIASSSSAWAAGALAHGGKPNANAAPPLVPIPSTRPRRRRALLLFDRRFRLLCSPAIWSYLHCVWGPTRRHETVSDCLKVDLSGRTCQQNSKISSEESQSTFRSSTSMQVKTIGLSP